MTYRPLKSFQHPADLNVTLMRYMSVAKFESMLKTGALYFARGDKFDDPQEGMLPKCFADAIRTNTAPASNIYEMHHQLAVNSRYDTYVNCWRLTGDEMHTMWMLYARDGVAIRSTYPRFLSSFGVGPLDICVGVVKYGADHLVGLKQWPDGFAFWLHKRKSFHIERELRALIWRPRNDPNPSFAIEFIDGSTEYPPVGVMVQEEGVWRAVGATVMSPDTAPAIQVGVDLRRLVDAVILNPWATADFAATISDLVMTYDYDFTVQPSSLR